MPSCARCGRADQPLVCAEQDDEVGYCPACAERVEQDAYDKFQDEQDEMAKETRRSVAS